jgi:hypothetical protein
MSGGQPRKQSGFTGGFFVATRPSLLPLAISLVAWSIGVEFMDEFGGDFQVTQCLQIRHRFAAIVEWPSKGAQLGIQGEGAF